MGMAASQARYLALTARQNNVEYEGQQVNQQRTALANQSASLYNEMLALDVPTPPSATDYTKTVYTFTDPSMLDGTTTINNIIRNPIGADGVQSYTLNITNNETVTNANKLTFNNLAVGTASGNNEKPIIYPYGNPGKSYTLQEADVPGALYEDFNKTGSAFDENTKFYSFYNGNNGVYYYIPATQTDAEGNTLSALDYIELMSQNPAALSDLTVYSVQTDAEEKMQTIRDAYLSVAEDGTGRYTYVSFYTEDKYETVDGVRQLKEGVTENDRSQFKLTQQTVSDDDAFDAAMETYEAKKAIYEKTVSDINSKTEIIQAQDKTLELHLRQLDTEQKAISNEMEAVKKVIDKNVESTFKTFA